MNYEGKAEYQKKEYDSNQKPPEEKKRMIPTQ
jgi:hypothetical protein